MSTHEEKLVKIIQDSGNPALAVLAAFKVFEAFLEKPQMSPAQILAYLQADSEMIASLKGSCACDPQKKD